MRTPLRLLLIASLLLAQAGPIATQAAAQNRSSKQPVIRQPLAPAARPIPVVFDSSVPKDMRLGLDVRLAETSGVGAASEGPAAPSGAAPANAAFSNAPMEPAAPGSAEPQDAAQDARAALGFDGALGAGQAPQDATRGVSSERLEKLDALFDGSRIKVYLTREGAAPIAATLTELRAVLTAHPEYASAFRRKGRARMIVAKDDPNAGLAPADAERVQRALREASLDARVNVETLPIEWEAPASETAAPRRRLFGEPAYLARAFRASLKSPTWPEVAGGLAAKALPSILGVLAWQSELLVKAQAPWAFAAMAAVGLGLNLFHGVGISTWSRFQNLLGRQRGINYQAGFNLVYGQFWGALMRVITWTAIAGTIAPWMPSYWGQIGVTVLVGTFIGALGGQSLNIMYNKGRVSEMGLSFLQLLRDLMMTLSGVFFAMGDMKSFVPLFIAQQVFDLTIYAIGQRLSRRPIAYVVSEHVALKEDFAVVYPTAVGRADPSPLRQAGAALAEFPLVKGARALARRLREAVRRRP